MVALEGHGLRDATVKVSIIVPLYNCERFVEALLVRLQASARTDFEMLLVDDGSTDGTRERTLRLIDRIPRARLLAQGANQGVSRARQRAISEAVGEFLWFVDADDAWAPNAVDRLLGVAEATNADVVVCRAERREPAADSGTVIDGLAIQAVFDNRKAVRMLLRGQLHGYLWNKLIRRDLLRGHSFPAITSQSDFLMTSFALASAARIASIPDTLYYHYTQSGSITRTRNPDLSNLLVCRDHFAATCDDAGLQLPFGLWEYFNLWFCVLPMAKTPARLASDSNVIRMGIEMAIESAKDCKTWRSLRYSPCAVVEYIAIRALKKHYLLVRRLAITASNLGGKARVRGRTSGN
jgi:glycosyltransferase involved in cell wall biosynthesis